ncbi:YitT family protein [Mycoplasma nasistruthionis]|nr:YitT family protein [Mycoplasma nasistruthionis]
MKPAEFSNDQLNECDQCSKDPLSLCPSHNNFLNQDEIQENLECMKYKMGQYLLNNKKTKLSFKILVQRYWFRVLLIFLAAWVFNFGIHMFLSKSDTIPSGITGVPTLLQYLFPVLSKWFALIYFACNVPLFLMFWRKIKKSFVYLTLLFMLFLQLSNTVLTIQSIHVFLFEKISFIHTDYNHYAIAKEGLRSFKIIEITDSNATLPQGYINVMNVYQSISNSTPIEGFSTLTIEQLTQLIWYHEGKTWAILVYGTLGALLIGVGISLSWRAGGSTGGTDIIAYYFSTKSKRSVSSMLSIVGFITAVMFLVIYGLVKPNINGELFGMRELSTFCYLVVTNLIINILYPKYKKVQLTIVTNEPEKVVAYFKLINYWHSYRFVEFESGYTGNKCKKIETVMLLLESKNIIHDLKIIDPKIWVSVKGVHSIAGNFNTEYVEQ